MSIHNFSAGPAMLPAPVLEHVQAELRDYQGLGMSMMEISHRTPAYEAINCEAEAAFKRLIGVGDHYRVLFLQGGASTQFAMLPMNFLSVGQTADYLVTGAWAEKAYEEASTIGQAQIAASTRESGYTRMPHSHEISLSEHSAYVHITSNETIQGTQWHVWPDVGQRPFVADMSSDILSRPIDASQFVLIYAGAQKNLGPAGVTVVVINREFLAQASSQPPAILRYATHAKHNSLYNTPPTFGVYVLGLVLQWIEQLGGVEAIARRNRYKADLIYSAIDRSAGFYRGHADLDARSEMNITFRLPDPAQEKRFIVEATAQGMIGLAGHRSVGGIRASIYNALEALSCAALVQFMDEFARNNG